MSTDFHAADGVRTGGCRMRKLTRRDLDLARAISAAARELVPADPSGAQVSVDAPGRSERLDGWIGTSPASADAGVVEVSHPASRRLVMRIGFWPGAGTGDADPSWLLRSATGRCAG